MENFCNTCCYYVHSLQHRPGRHANKHGGLLWQRQERDPYLQLSRILINGHFESNDQISVLQDLNNEDVMVKCPLCSIVLLSTNHDRLDHLNSCIYKKRGGNVEETNEQPNTMVADYRRSERHIMQERGTLITYRSKNVHNDFLKEFSKLKNSFLKDFQEGIRKYGHFKVALETPMLFRSKLPLYSGIHEDKLRHITTNLMQVHSIEDADMVFDFWLSKIKERIEQFQEGQSGMVLVSLIQFNVRMFESNPLTVGCGSTIPEKLKLKLGREHKDKLISPYTPNETTCVLWCCSIYITELERIDRKKQDIKTHLEELAKRECFTIDYLKEHYQAWFDVLAERCKKLTFPVSISKTALKKLARVLNLPLQLNFVAYDDERDEFYNIFCDLQTELFESILSEPEGSVLQIENHCLDILLVPHQEDIHSVLITNLKKLLSYLTKRHDNPLLCRICLYRTYKPELYFDHIRKCGQNNLEHTILKMKQGSTKSDGSIQAPLIQGQPSLGVEPNLFLSFYDTETNFKMPEKRDDTAEIFHMKPAMMYIETHLSFPPHETEQESIKFLKTQPFPTQVFTGRDCVEQCIKVMIQHAIDACNRTDRVREHYRTHQLSEAEENQFLAATECIYCKIEFDETDPTKQKVREHTHLSSRPLFGEADSNYRGPACIRCNNLLRLQRQHICLSYNGCSFDHLLVLKALLDCHQQRRPLFYKLRILPKNTRKVLSLEFDNFCPYCDRQDQETGLVTRTLKEDAPCPNHVKLKFLDFYAQFPMTSLAKLTESYGYEVEQGVMTAEERFPISYKGFKDMGLDSYFSFDSFRKKGIFPYLNFSYVKDGDELEFLKQTHFPTIEEWKVGRDEKPISQEVWTSGKEMWDGLCRYYQDRGVVCTMGLFLEAYLKTDVRCLGDVCIGLSLENFRLYGLFTTSFVSLSQFSFNAFLKNATVKLEMLTDPRIHEHFSDPIAGLVNVSGRRLVTANRCDVPGYYDAKKNSRFLLFLDATSLYPSSLLFTQPFQNFRILSDAETERLFVDITEHSIHDSWTDEYAMKLGNRCYGYSLTCDLELADESLHDLLDSAPLFPTREKVPDSWLSPYQLKMKREMNLKTDQSDKILSTLLPKKRIRVDFRYLRYGLKLGYRLTALHEVVEFELSFVTRDFVQKNAEIRRQAKTDVAQRYVKAVANTLSGRLGSSGKKHLHCKLITDVSAFKKEIKKPGVKNYMELNSETGLLLLYKRFYTPKHASFIYYTLLSVSKYLMVRFHYDHVVPTFYSKQFLCFQAYQDTDSTFLVLTSLALANGQPNIGLEDLRKYYGVLRELAPYLDLSGFSVDHPLFQWETSDQQKTYLLQLREDNYKRLLTFGSETGGDAITRGIFLAAKAYSIEIYKAGKMHEKFAYKGVSKKSFHCKHEDILRFYLGDTYKIIYNHNVITNKNFELLYRTSEKVALTRYYDKKYMTRQNICLSYGNYNIPLLRAVEDCIEFLLDSVCGDS